MCAGPRVEELFQLNVCDIELKEKSGSLHIRKGKGFKERRTSIPLPARKALQTWLELYEDLDVAFSKNSPLFIRPRGKTGGRLSIWAIQDMVSEVGKRARMKEPVTPHILRHNGHELIAMPLRFNFWRAPTDNDIGTYGRERMMFTWKDAGLNRLEEMVQSVSVEQPNEKIARVHVQSKIAPRPIEGRSLWWNWLLEQLALVLTQTWNEQELSQIADELGAKYSELTGAKKWQRVKELLDLCDKKGSGYQSLRVIARWLDQTDPDVFESLKQRLARLRSLDEQQFEYEFRLRDDFHFECKTEYEVSAEPEIQITTQIAPVGEVPVLPRIGYQLALPEEYNELWWYGRGPLESYPDRQQGMRMGIFHGTVEDQFVPYGRPQETGNKTSVRWAAYMNQNGYGLFAHSQEPLNVGALHYTMQDLESARHPVDLIRRNETYLTLDFRHAGLGNASCGPGTLPQYVILPEASEYRLCLHPITPNDPLLSNHCDTETRKL